MRILHLSDTHTLHEQLPLQEADILIHSGDAANSKDIFQNTGEIILFIEWLGQIRSRYKEVIFVPGNHDLAIEKREKFAREMCKEAGVILLINEAVEVDGVKFWGSPLTPEFGIDWAYNRDRGKIHKAWAKIPDDTQVLITHGPPKSFLDVSENRRHELELTGCAALASRISNLKSLKANLFGHIHNNDRIINQGLRIHNGVTYSNAACITDRKFDDGLSSFGNILDI